MITQNDFQPSAAIWRHRCFRWNHTCLRDLSLLRLWSSSSGGRTHSGSLAKVCLKGNMAHLFNATIQNVQFPTKCPCKYDCLNHTSKKTMATTVPIKQYIFQKYTPCFAAIQKHSCNPRAIDAEDPRRKELAVAERSNCEPNCVYICMQFGRRLKPETKSQKQHME